MNKEVLASHVADIEAGMKEYMPEENGYQRTVFEAVNYSLLAGGKRLRPMFLYEAYRMFGGTDEKAVRPFMMALEMIHTYSLVHDDLPAMDNDEYRRGKLTTHKKFGEAMGILSGDALLNGAFETAFLAFDSETEAAQIGRALKILGHKAGMYGMVGGQVVDVEKDGCFMDEDMLYFVHKNKTSALIEAALMTGAVLAGADEKQAAVMEQCGADIGLAFQIQDDILDLTSSLEVLGKQTGSDLKNHKVTYVSLNGMERSIEEVRRLSEEAITGLASFSLAGKETVRNEFLEALVEDLITRKK